MKITNLKVSGFKNLLNCELKLDGIHAITGPNGAGKTNLIEAFQFVIALQSTIETERKMLLEAGVAPFLDWRWFPIWFEGNEPRAFEFTLDASLEFGGETWLITYSIVLEKPVAVSGLIATGPKKIVKEELALKQEGKPGPATKAIVRNEAGKTLVQRTSAGSTKEEFDTNLNMLALHALEVREANNFAINYPVISAFRRALLATSVLRLNPAKIMSAAFSTSESEPERKPWAIIDHVAFHEKISEIRKNKKNWNDFTFWLNQLCGITDVQLAEPQKNVAFKFVLFTHHGLPSLLTMLSTGTAYLTAMLVNIFSLKDSGGIFVIDEPETYLHPRALVDLTALLRKISETNTMLLATHSPIVLNSLSPDEVTLMTPIDSKGCLYTTKRVSEMKDAIATLHRGYISFGEMLETNFKNE